MEREGASTVTYSLPHEIDEDTRKYVCARKRSEAIGSESINPDYETTYTKSTRLSPSSRTERAEGD